RLVRDPTAVGREHRLPLVEATLQEHRGLTGIPARRFVTFHRQDQQVVTPLQVLLGEREQRAAWMPRAGDLWVLAVRETLGVADAVGQLPVEIERSLVPPIGPEHDTAAIRGPDGPSVAWTRSQTRERVPRQLVHPDVGNRSNIDLQGEPATIGRKLNARPV